MQFENVSNQVRFSDMMRNQRHKRQRYLLDDAPAQMRRRDLLDDVPVQNRQRDLLDDVPAQLSRRPVPDEIPSKRIRQINAVDYCLSDDNTSLVERSSLLVGSARGNEIIFKKLNDSDKKEVQKAMSKEWTNWEIVRATKDLTVTDLGKLQKTNLGLRIVGTRWVITRIVDDQVYKQKVEGKVVLRFKARLVVLGCQEEKGTFRRNFRTSSKEAFFLTLAAAYQNDWTIDMFDAESAFLQTSGQMKR